MGDFEAESLKSRGVRSVFKGEILFQRIGTKTGPPRFRTDLIPNRFHPNPPMRNGTNAARSILHIDEERKQIGGEL